MQLYDITVSLDAGTPVYEGDPPIEIIPQSSLAAGDLASVSLLKFGSHSGTHIDAPSHFIPEGKSIDQIPLEFLIGTAQVLEVKAKNGYISLDDLAKVHEETTRILLKTNNSSLWKRREFVKDFICLSPEAADWIIEKNIKLVGIDYLSIERFHSSDHYVHKTLLGNNVIILEGLNLSEVQPGIYNLVCLPLKITGCDGSPVRAILTS